jgi:hypothetical protein
MRDLLLKILTLTQFEQKMKHKRTLTTSKINLLLKTI